MGQMISFDGTFCFSDDIFQIKEGEKRKEIDRLAKSLVEHWVLFH